MWYENINEFVKKYLGLFVILIFLSTQIGRISINKKINRNYDHHIKSYLDSVESSYKKKFGSYIKDQIKDRLIIEELTKNIDSVNKGTKKRIINYNRLRNELKSEKITLPPLDSLSSN